MIKSRTPWLDFIRNVNFNPTPSLIGIRMDSRRQFGAIRPRNIGGGKFKIPETYDKYFVVDRNYNMRWDLTKSMNIDFKAVNNSRVDEPFGRLDTKEKRDSVMRNLFKGEEIPSTPKVQTSPIMFRPTYFHCLIGQL